MSASSWRMWCRRRKTELHWTRIPLGRDRKTPLEIVALAEKINLIHVDYDENKKIYLTDFDSLASTLAVNGLAITGTEDELVAARANFYPQWNPTPYEDVIA